MKTARRHRSSSRRSLSKGENALFWLNGGHYYKHHGTLTTPKQLIPTPRPGNQETWDESARTSAHAPSAPTWQRPPLFYTFLMGLEGLLPIGTRAINTGSVGSGPQRKPGAKETLGDLEFMVKGMHRVSQFNALFQGHYDFVRPVRHYDAWNHDHPLIRGSLNGRYLLLAMTNPYLDPGETQTVELRYGAPFEAGGKAGLVRHGPAASPPGRQAPVPVQTAAPACRARLTTRTNSTSGTRVPTARFGGRLPSLATTRWPTRKRWRREKETLEQGINGG